MTMRVAHGRRSDARRVLLLPLVALLGCHSAFINVTVQNQTGELLSPVEVDYPSASFGIPALAAGASYKYRVKVLGSGSTKVLWTDAAHHDHAYAGPSLREGQEGALTILLEPRSANWVPVLQP